MSDWTAIASLDDIPRLGARRLQTDGPEIAVFRTGNDQVYALKDRCPHRGGPLSQGIVHGNSVTCPLHNWRIELENGEVLGPDEGCVHTYAVKVEDGTIYLKLTANESAA